MGIDDATVQAISATRAEWIHPFTVLKPAQVRRLVRVVAQRGGDQIADGAPGAAVGVGSAGPGAAGRGVPAHQPDDAPDRAAVRRLALRRTSRHPHPQPVAGIGPDPPTADRSATIVDGTLISTRDHRLAAPSKNYRYPTNHQLAIDANTRLVVVAGVERASGRAGAHMRIHLPRVARETAADRARSSHAMTVTIRERQLITAVHARAE